MNPEAPVTKQFMAGDGFGERSGSAGPLLFGRRADVSGTQAYYPVSIGERMVEKLSCRLQNNSGLI
jgi:hypothetical protein